ncbi:MAG: protein kinase [Lachnospiraceae bacterium]|nr:protein kinase [Lachnospiraceae bacterium]
MKYERLDRRGRERYLDRVVLAGRGYVRRRLLGQGAFSDVYCVEEAESGRRYACKISARAGMLEREARTLAGLRHPLYPEFAAFWREGELGILLREYVQGDSLEEMLKRRRFSPVQTVRTGLSLAEGLLYLHELPERLLFRDVKPANVIVTEDGGIKLIDLGCVCSMAGEVASRAGSPGFAPPEQLNGTRLLTPSCDVYGLGKTLEAMLGQERRGRRHTGAWQQGGQRRIGRSCPGPGRVIWPGGGRGISAHPRARQRAQAQKKLLRILRNCTREEAAERMADMRRVMEAFARIL